MRGVPPSTVDARMKNPTRPEAKGCYAFHVLKHVPFLPPETETRR